jgi:uncharacterized membrane protein
MTAANDRTGDALGADLAECGYVGRGGGGRYGWVPFLAVAGLLVGLAVVAWLLPPPSVPGPVPPLWPFVPFGLVLVVVLVVLVVRSTGRGYGPWWGGSWSYGASAREIVRRRYARGEITAQQLHEMLRELDPASR